MNLVLVGTSHRTAPVNIREKLHFPEPRLHEALQLLKSAYDLQESMILSTCNRVEVLAHAPDTTLGVHQVRDFICEFHQLKYDSLQE